MGIILRRTYLGETHEVEIVDPIRPMTQDPARSLRRGFWRYQYRGVRWRSLSAIAAYITGNRTESGPRFFGLRTKK